MASHFKNKVALVTGASRGIGRAIAIELAAGGAEVFVNYCTNENKAKETLREIEAAGGTARLLRFDVSDSDAVAAGVESVMKKSGRIDILVNNAGLTKDGLLLRYKEEDLRNLIDVNLIGTFLVTKAVVRHMLKARYGRIVNLTSVVGQCGHEGQAAYSATKAAIIGFTKSVAREFAKRNITCNAIAPGFIETDLTASLDEKARNAFLNQIPMARFGTPQEVAAVAGWLASDAADYITGAVIPVNGGIYM